MKIKIVLILILLGLFIGCETLLDPAVKEVDAAPPRPLQNLETAMVSSSNAFGFDIFRAMAENSADSNLFISPLSISFALGMAYNGADGETEAAMRQTLGYGNMTKTQINQTYASLIDLLTKLDEKVRFTIANSAWAREGFTLQPVFVNDLQEYFDAEMRSLNFSDPAAVDIINGWVSDKTQGKIDQIIDEIHPLTVLFLINALYFKADWAAQFDPDLTTDDVFMLENGLQTDVQMMRLTAEFSYFENDLFQAVDLPYGNGFYSMTVLLPKADKTVADITEQLTEAGWSSWMTQFNEQELSLQMPRFKIEYEKELKDILASLGMGIAFTDQADFSGINPDYELFISQVLHKTIVEVDEVGTEAAAVTVIDFRTTSIGTSVRLDRPFVFVIHDKHSGSLLFMGILANPAGESD